MSRLFALIIAGTHFLLLLASLSPIDEASAKDPSPTRASPQRIVSLTPSVTETLFALGVGDRLVGVTTYCDYPAQARRLPKIGNFSNPSVEAVLAKQPDLVVGVSQGANHETIRHMERLGLRVLLMSVSSLSDIFNSISLLSREVGRQQAGEKLKSLIQGSIDRVTERIAGTKRRRVLMVVGLRPLVAVGGGTYIDELLTLAGGENIAAVTSLPWPHLSREYVIAKAPQVIIEGGMGSEHDAPGKRWGDLSSIPAVKENRVYSYLSDKILRPGPRIGEALEELARLIHPERFVPPHEKSGKEK